MCLWAIVKLVTSFWSMSAETALMSKRTHRDGNTYMAGLAFIFPHSMFEISLSVAIVLCLGLTESKEATLLPERTKYPSCE